MTPSQTLIDLIRKRQTVRQYQEKKVEDHKLSLIIEAARMAPSACNAQGWRFIVVEDRELLNKINDKGLGGIVANQWARTAPVIITGCYKKDILTHHLGERAKGIKYHFLDMGIAGEHMALMAQALGLGTCWIGWFKQGAVKKILGIPRSLEVVFLMTLGYPREEPRPKSRLPADKIAFKNRFPGQGNVAK